MSPLHVVVWLVVALLLVAALALQAQPADQPEKLPGSIREAYGRAEEFGEEPEQKPAESGEPEPNPWFDGVHYVGAVGGLFLLAGIGTGLWIYLVIALP